VALDAAHLRRGRGGRRRERRRRRAGREGTGDEQPHPAPPPRRPARHSRQPRDDDDDGPSLKDAGARREEHDHLDGDDGASCYNLALTRRDARADDPTASGLFDKACQLGLVEACSAKPR
jgi:hypothetical protein